MTFDPTKPVQTRDGRKVRIICTDAAGPHPIVALIKVEKEGRECSHQFSKIGSYFANSIASELDLINIPERKVRWVNVYEDSTSGQFAHRESADACAAVKRLGILKLIYENDELVDHEYEKLK
jgi:hypothetical protein